MGSRRLGDVFHSALAPPPSTLPSTPPLASTPRSPRRRLWLGLVLFAIVVGLTATVYFVAVAHRSVDDDPTGFSATEPAEVHANCDTVDACRARCEAHHTPACHRLVRLRDPGLKYPENSRAACELGAGDACSQYAINLDHESPRSDARSEEAARYRARAEHLNRTHCDGGDALSCWELGDNEYRKHSINCKPCYEAYAKACSLGFLSGCSWAIRTATESDEEDAAWRTGIRIVLGTCNRDRGLDLPCSKAIAAMTVDSFLPTDQEQRRVTRARSILNQRLGSSLAGRCPASVDACVGHALLEHKERENREKAHDRVQHVMELLGVGCYDQRRPDHCLGLAYISGGPRGAVGFGLDGFGEYFSPERARRAGLHACGLARSRDRYLGWPVECDFIFSRMSAEEVAETLKQDEYTQ